MRKAFSITISVILLLGTLSLVVWFYSALNAVLGKLTWLLFLVMVGFWTYLFEHIVDMVTGRGGTTGNHKKTISTTRKFPS